MYKLINQILHHWVILMNNVRMYHCSTMIVHPSLGFLSIRTHQKIVKKIIIFKNRQNSANKS